MTTTVVAYTSFCEGQVTRFSSLRTSERKSRMRSKRLPAASFTVSNRPASSATFALTLPPNVHLRALPTVAHVPPSPTSEGWQARRESNPQPPVLETGALPIELLAYNSHQLTAVRYLPSLCAVCFRQKRQYLLISSRSVVFFLFF